jgi:hypothetical protein
MSDTVNFRAGHGPSSAVGKLLEISPAPMVIVGANSGSMSAVLQQMVHLQAAASAYDVARKFVAISGRRNSTTSGMVTVGNATAHAVMGATGVTSIAGQMVQSVGFTDLARNFAAAAGMSDVAEQIAVTASIRSAMSRSVVASLAKRALLRRIREDVARVKERARRAQAHIFAALEKARTREDRRRIGFSIAMSSAKRIARAAALTALAVRTHVDHSPPPAEAITTTPRKVRGPNSRQRHRFVVVAGPPSCHRGRGSRSIPGVLHARSQPTHRSRTRVPAR